MLAVIRISGLVKIKRTVAETLDRLRLGRKYACVLVKEDSEKAATVSSVKDFVAYGEIDETTLIKLVKARGKKVDKSEISDAEGSSIAEDLLSGKKAEELGIKPFFRLHPPRGGINSKALYPKGVLGNNKADINKLIERML